jgi:hypothetical protein
MIRRRRGTLVAATAMISLSLMVLRAEAAEMTQERIVKYMLATLHAARTAYVEQVLQQAQRAGIQPKEDWPTNDHAIMLPFQFVKMVALEMKSMVKDFEIGIVSLSPIYTANFPKTQAEARPSRG